MYVFDVFILQNISNLHIYYLLRPHQYETACIYGNKIEQFLKDHSKFTASCLLAELSSENSQDNLYRTGLLCKSKNWMVDIQKKMIN